jgi:hypothetical protein
MSRCGSRNPNREIRFRNLNSGNKIPVIQFAKQTSGIWTGSEFDTATIPPDTATGSRRPDPRHATGSPTTGRHDRDRGRRPPRRHRRPDPDRAPRRTPRPGATTAGHRDTATPRHRRRRPLPAAHSATTAKTAPTITAAVTTTPPAPTRRDAEQQSRADPLPAAGTTEHRATDTRTDRRTRNRIPTPPVPYGAHNPRGTIPASRTVSVRLSWRNRPAPRDRHPFERYRPAGRHTVAENQSRGSLQSYGRTKCRQ